MNKGPRRQTIPAVIGLWCGLIGLGLGAVAFYRTIPDGRMRSAHNEHVLGTVRSLHDRMLDGGPRADWGTATVVFSAPDRIVWRVDSDDPEHPSGEETVTLTQIAEAEVEVYYEFVADADWIPPAAASAEVVIPPALPAADPRSEAPDRNPGPRNPRFSPDGRHVAFLYGSQVQYGDVHLDQIGAATAFMAASAGEYRADSFAWHPDGSLVVAAEQPPGNPIRLWTAVPGRDGLTAIQNIGVGSRMPAVSGSGDHIAFDSLTEAGGEGSVVVYDVTTGQVSWRTATAPLASPPMFASESTLVYADGEQLVRIAMNTGAVEMAVPIVALQPAIAANGWVVLYRRERGHLGTLGRVDVNGEWAVLAEDVVIPRGPADVVDERVAWIGESDVLYVGDIYGRDYVPLDTNGRVDLHDATLGTLGDSILVAYVGRDSWDSDPIVWTQVVP